jgi:hypothetical protein
MARVTLGDVQAWLDPVNFNLDDDDTLPEAEQVTSIVFGFIGGSYDTTVWTEPEDTPPLIRTIISGLVAARKYQARYSETEDGGNAYADRIERQLMKLLDQIAEGVVVIPGVDGSGGTDITQPAYWPDNSTGRSDLLDDLGRKLLPAGAQSRSFYIGMDAASPNGGGAAW